MDKQLLDLGLNAGYTKEEIYECLEDLEALTTLSRETICTQYCGLFGCTPKNANLYYLYNKFHKGRNNIPPEWFRNKYFIPKELQKQYCSPIISEKNLILSRRY